MGKRGLRHSARQVAKTQAAAARSVWAVHLKLCWQCHAADGRPGLFCDQGFTLAQALARASLAAALTGQCPDQAQGTLL